MPCSISALWPHLFTPMPPHNATTRQHWLMLFESWSVSQRHAPSPPQTALTHLSTCLPVSCHSQGRNVCSHVYPSPEPLHGSRHVSSCICCVSVRCLTCLQACGIRAPRVDDIDTVCSCALSQCYPVVEWTYLLTCLCPKAITWLCRLASS